MNKTQVIALLLSTTSTIQAVKCPFGHTAPAVDNQLQTLATLSDQVKAAQYPSHVLTCPAGKTKVMKTDSNVVTKEDYEAIANGVIAEYEKVTAETTSTENKRASFAGCLVRLAGHDLMDFRKAKDGSMSGGSDGCVNFHDDDNAGLAKCLAKSGIQTTYESFCDKVSLADFMVIAAEAVMGRTATKYDSADPWKAGTLLAQFRDSFKPGRTTLEECPDNHGLMPNPEDGCEGLQNVFIDHIYNHVTPKKHRWEFTAALSGAHTLGGAQVENSGYIGKWSDVNQQGIFNNDYYVSLLRKGWGPQLKVNGNEKKNQFKRVDMVCDDQVEMMLSTDICLAYQDNPTHRKCMEENGHDNSKCWQEQRKGHFIRAQDVDCCVWSDTQMLFWGHWAKGERGMYEGESNDYCGLKHNKVPLGFKANRELCCDKMGPGSVGDCDSSEWPKGPAFDFIIDFQANEDYWLETYQKAWATATTNAFPELAPEDVDQRGSTACTKFKYGSVGCQKNPKCKWTGAWKEGGGGCTWRTPDDPLSDADYATFVRKQCEMGKWNQKRCNRRKDKCKWTGGNKKKGQIGCTSRTPDDPLYVDQRSRCQQFKWKKNKCKKISFCQWTGAKKAGGGGCVKL